MMTCDICGGSKRVRLPVHRKLNVSAQFADLADEDKIAETSREYDCPQCVKKVEYRRVKAVKIVQRVDAIDFGRYQNPLERGLSQQFGTYLMKEGLIKFGVEDDPADATRVFIAAAINIVTQANAKIAGAEEYVAETDAAPRIPRRRGSVEITPGYSIPGAWKSEPKQVFKPPQSRRERVREAAAKRSGITSRFSGIDLDGDDAE